MRMINLHDNETREAALHIIENTLGAFKNLLVDHNVQLYSVLVHHGDCHVMGLQADASHIIKIFRESADHLEEFMLTHVDNGEQDLIADTRVKKS